MIQRYPHEGKTLGTPREASAPRSLATKSARADATAQKHGATIHRLKIQLLGIKPPIWRRVEIPSDTVLPRVSRILLMAMGWTDSHLHAFRARGITYAVPDSEFSSDDRNERRVTLVQLAPRANDRFTFIYDFGDNWEHRVEVEAILEVDDALAYPRCVAGKRACPPEDCGGPPGYASLLEALADPEHEDNAAMTEWAVRRFDPNRFDLAKTNAGVTSLPP